MTNNPAMGMAIESIRKYCQENNTWFDIHYFQGSNEYGVLIGIPFGKEWALDLMKKNLAASLESAIYDALKRHREGK